jgi:hypothetical protein
MAIFYWRADAKPGAALFNAAPSGRAALRFAQQCMAPIAPGSS